MRILSQIEIPKRSLQCAKGQELFLPGMEYISSLFEEGQEIQRQDYCMSCWEVVKKQESNATASYWKAKIALKKSLVDRFRSRDEKALDLFREMGGCKTMASSPEAFVLALYLARRKIVFLRRELVQENGETAMIYEVADTEELYSIKRFALTSLETSAIQQTLATKLL